MGFLPPSSFLTIFEVLILIMRQRIYIDIPEKTFDAVKMMREIRDKISAETQNMTFEELKAYITQKLADSKTELVGQR